MSELRLRYVDLRTFKTRVDLDLATEAAGGVPLTGNDIEHIQLVRSGFINPREGGIVKEDVARAA